MRKISGKILRVSAYVLTIVLLLLVIEISRNCSRYEPGPRIGNSGGDTIDIAILYGPGSLYLYSDTLSGLNRELLREFSMATGIPSKIWPVSDAEDAMKKIETGNFDILASLPLNNSLKNRFQTSESLFLDRLVLVQLADSVTGETTINSSLDLIGKPVYIASGSSALSRLQNLSKEIGGDIEIISEDELSDELLCLKVISGNIKYAVVNERIASRMAKKYPRLSYDNPVSFTQFQVWLFNPSDSMLYQKFYDWFEDFRTDETYREILNRF